MATFTKRLAGDADLYFATGGTGAEETFTATAADGKTLTFKKIDANDLKFLQGMDSVPYSVEDTVDGGMSVYWLYDSYEALVTALGDTPATIVVWNTQSIAANLSVPSTIETVVLETGRFSIATGKTLTFARKPQAGNYQIFVYNGTGVATFGVEAGHDFPVEWWGLDGAADEVAINRAITAVPLRSTLWISARPVIADQILWNRCVNIRGRGLPSTTSGGANPGTVTIPSDTSGTVINASAAGLAGKYAILAVATMQEAEISDLWLYGGTGAVASNAIGGIDLPANVSRTTIRNVRITGFSQAPGTATGTYYGVRFAGGSSNFSNVLQNAEIYYNDIGVYLGSYAQQSTLRDCKIVWNYKYGIHAYDHNTLTIDNCQVEKNGAAAPTQPGGAGTAVLFTSAGVFIDACQNVNINNIYMEQTTTWPGAGIIIGNTTGGLPRKIWATGRIIGNSQATYGIIVNRGQDIDLSKMRVYNFTSKNFAANPFNNLAVAVNTAILNNIKRPKYYGTTYHASTDTPLIVKQQMVKNPLLDRWSAADTLLGGWAATGGTLSQESTDTGRLGTVCAKLVGAGSATTAVYLQQTLSATAIQMLEAAEHGQIKVYVKLDLANPENVTPSISAAGRELALDKDETDWQEVRYGFKEGSSGVIKVNLCTAAETAAADDIIYVSYVGVVAGLEDMEGFPDGPSRILYAKLSDTKDNNTAGGTFTAAAWQTRVLNTEDNDVDGIVSVASNQFTLQAGTYRILARAPAVQVNLHKARLQNITAGSTTLLGSNAYAGAAEGVTTTSVVSGEFTITSATLYEIQHYCQTTNADDGFGIACNFSVSEVYTIVEIWKID